jgi:hypothetical protein
MGQKVNPHGLRVGVIKDWDSMWYAEEDFADNLVEDYQIRKFLKDKLYNAGIAKVEIERASDKNIKIKVHAAKPGVIIGKGGAEVGGNNLDYPFDWLYDYKPESGASSFASASVWSSNFRLVIFGVTSDPEIRINGHLYKVFGDISENEYLTIDSATREIYLTTNIGNRVNRFNDRYRRSYIFEQIAAGMVNVMWDGKFAFELYILDEGREPRWN